MRSPYTRERLDVWPAFTDFVTAVSLLLVLLLAAAPWFLTSEILMPRVEGFEGTDTQRFNPAEVLESRQKELQNALKDVPGVRFEERGQEQRLIFQEGRGILFDTAQATLKPQFRERLRPLRKALVEFMRRGYLERIEVEGHSDSVPFRGGGDSNWSLSARRAVSVAEFLIASSTIPPWKVTANGYGEFKPAHEHEPTLQRTRDDWGVQYRYIVENNRTPKQRAENRRIEILLFYEWPRDPATAKAPSRAAPPSAPAGPPTSPRPRPPGSR